MLRNKNIFFNIFITLSLIATISFTSCKKEEPETIDSDAYELQVQDVSISNESTTVEEVQKWRQTNKKICVFFGYDFNTPEIIENYTNILSENFGLVEDGGLIYTITYPNSFKHPKSYISELNTMLSEADGDLIGLIILGAPENTHYALGRLQDYWNMKIPYPIFSLFPQDESLGMESTCDFVLDKFISAEITGEVVSEDAELVVKEAPKVLISTINYMKNLNGAFTKNSSIQNHVVQMFKGYKLQYYTDPETGLHAINHFILY